MLDEAVSDIACHACVKGSVFVGAEDIDVTVSHASNFTAWIAWYERFKFD